MSIAPIIMVRNEERFIQVVLQPLVDVFGLAIVGDTGSTDDTTALALSVPGVHLVQLGVLGPRELGRAREELCRQAARLGAQWALQVDGDELYSRAALRAIQAQPMPAGRELGFTVMISVDEDQDTGALWELDDFFNRAALYPVTARQMGEYPFEAPEQWLQGESVWHYFDLPAGLRYHAVHLHRLQRSRHDAEVYRRQEKRFQFAMRERQVPRTRPFDLDAWREL